MAKRPETAAEWAERYERKARKAYDDYQATGISRYWRQFEEYDMICSAFSALLDRRKDREADIRKRCINRDWAIDKLVHASYTRNEVIELLNEAVYW